MSIMKPMESRRVWMGRLPHGADLLGELNRICSEQDVRAGRIEALGAVRKARLACYDQRTRTYRYFDLDRPLEMTQLTGNVSLKDGLPFVHAHVTLADEDGTACGGHLAPGTIIFACEFVLEAYDGAPLERVHDPETGLPLWGP